jgi:hypothetical protein
VHEFSEEVCVSDAVNDACEKWENAALAWEHITWALARDIKIGRSLNESGTLRLLIWQGARSIQMPDVQLVYKIESPTIRFMEVIFADAKAAIAGTG